MQVFSVQVLLLSGFVISYAHPGKQHAEVKVTSKGSSDAQVASIGSGDQKLIENSPNPQAVVRSDGSTFSSESKWPVPQSAVEFGSFINQPATNVTVPSGGAQLGVAIPPANDAPVFQAPFAYKPDRPNVIQTLLSNVQGLNHSSSSFFVIPSSTTTEPSPGTNNTAMNDPLPNPLTGIISASQSTVSNATNAAQEITNLWSTNVGQNGFFGAAGNRPSNDPPASESTNSTGPSNPIQGIIEASQASWNNVTGGAQNLAGQFGANVQNGLSNIFGINVNRPSNDEPVRPVRPSNDQIITDSADAESTTAAVPDTSSASSNETTTTTTTPTPDTTAASTESTATGSATTTTATANATAVPFLPLVSFVNNTQSLVNSSVLIQSVTSQLVGNLQSGLGNLFINRPTKTKEANKQDFPELDADNRASGSTKTVTPPQRPNCPTCSSSCFYRPFQRIVDGIDVQPTTKYPWIALLTYLDSPSGQGSLINDRAIVTTATVIEAMPVTMHIRALLGVYNRAGPNTTVTSNKIKKTYVHPGFRTNNQFVDNIGLLILKNALMDFQAICLPAPRSESPPVPKATIIGWGATYAGGPLSNTKKEYELQMYPPIVCFMTAPQSTPKNLCGGTPQFVSNAGATCTGDGGDPLVAKNVGTWELIGVALDIPEFQCGSQRIPAMFTSIIPYLSWITTYGVGCECYVG